MNEAIYKAQIQTPFGTFLFAVKEIKPYAKKTLTNLAYSEFKTPYGMLKIETPQKSNRRILSNMHPVKNANDYNSGQWGWMKKLK